MSDRCRQAVATGPAGETRLVVVVDKSRRGSAIRSDAARRLGFSRADLPVTLRVRGIDRRPREVRVLRDELEPVVLFGEPVVAPRILRQRDLAVDDAAVGPHGADVDVVLGAGYFEKDIVIGSLIAALLEPS